MVTRTGDPTAELVSLLREHCPECSDALLAQMAADIVSGDTDGLRWRALTLGQIPGVSEFVSLVEPPVQAISTVLSVVSGILDAISALLIDITDPFRALILAAYEILKDIVEDFLGTGAYVYTDAPGLVTNQAALVNLGMTEQSIPPWLAGGTPRRPAAPADGFTAWADRFKSSFDDAGDTRRPTFSDGAPVTAVFIVAAAPQLPDLARFASLYRTLLDTSKFEKAVDDFVRTFPEWPDDPDRSRLRSRSVAPDWRSWRLRDIGPPDYPLRELEKVPELLKALLVNGDSIVALIKALIAAIQDKIKVLQQMVKLIQQVIDLLKALSASGLHVLSVATNEGVDGLVDAFLTAEDRPGTDPQTGELTGTNAIVGACVLAGGSEIDPVAALTVWALLGQSGSMDQAFAGLRADVDALKDQSETAVADAEAALSKAWAGEEGRSGPGSQGISGLLRQAGRDLEEDKRQLERAVGRTVEQIEDALGGDRVGLAEAIGMAAAAGAPIDPLLLAHMEATRRAQRRGARSMALAMGSRQAERDGGPTT